PQRRGDSGEGEVALPQPLLEDLREVEEQLHLLPVLPVVDGGGQEALRRRGIATEVRRLTVEGAKLGEGRLVARMALQHALQGLGCHVRPAKFVAPQTRDLAQALHVAHRLDGHERFEDANALGVRLPLAEDRLEAKQLLLAMRGQVEDAARRLDRLLPLPQANEALEEVETN